MKSKKEKPYRFVAIPKPLLYWRRAGLKRPPDSAIVLFGYLVDHFNAKLGCAYPSFDRIQFELGWGRDKLTKALAWLVRHGFVKKVKSNYRNGARKNNAYVPQDDAIATLDKALNPFDKAGFKAYMGRKTKVLFSGKPKSCFQENQSPETSENQSPENRLQEDIATGTDALRSPAPVKEYGKKLHRDVSGGSGRKRARAEPVAPTANGNHDHHEQREDSLNQKERLNDANSPKDGNRKAPCVEKAVAVQVVVEVQEPARGAEPKVQAPTVENVAVQKDGADLGFTLDSVQPVQPATQSPSTGFSAIAKNSIPASPLAVPKNWEHRFEDVLKIAKRAVLDCTGETDMPPMVLDAVVAKLEAGTPTDAIRWQFQKSVERFKEKKASNQRYNGREVNLGFLVKVFKDNNGYEPHEEPEPAPNGTLYLTARKDARARAECLRKRYSQVEEAYSAYLDDPNCMAFADECLGHGYYFCAQYLADSWGMSADDAQAFVSSQCCQALARASNKAGMLNAFRKTVQTTRDNKKLYEYFDSPIWNDWEARTSAIFADIEARAVQQAAPASIS